MSGEDAKRKRGRPKGSLGPAARMAQEAQMATQVFKTDAPQPNYFVLCNGKPVKSIKELADVMDNIEDHVFTHHTKDGKNDFSAWVNDVFKEVELAKKLTGASDKKHFQLIVYKHIADKFLQK